MGKEGRIDSKGHVNRMEEGIIYGVYLYRGSISWQGRSSLWLDGWIHGRPMVVL